MNLSRLKNVRQRRGTVLMETLMVIPLYIAFLSGIYLLGDLALGRNRLSAADRFAVWFSGCRHTDKDDNAVQKATSAVFFPAGEFAEGTKLQSFRSHKTKVDWYALVRGAAELKMVLPVWAAGCRKGVIQLFADIGNAPDKNRWDNVQLPAREVEEPDTHSVLMRSRYDEREKTARQLAQGGPRWYVEYRTAYLDVKGNPNDRPGTLQVCESAEFVRNPQYEAWSR